MVRNRLMEAIRPATRICSSPSLLDRKALCDSHAAQGFLFLQGEPRPTSQNVTLEPTPAAQNFF